MKRGEKMRGKKNKVAVINLDRSDYGTEWDEIVWGYLRVSSDEQFDSGLGLKTQRKEVERYSFRVVEDNPGSIMGAVIEEPMGVSAFKVPWEKRPAGVALNDVMRDGDHLVVGRMDRCFRAPLDFYKNYQLWSDRGICVHLADMKINLSDGFGKLMAGFLVMIAEWQSRYISERTREALDRKREAKQICGRVPVGYKAVQNGRYLIEDKLDNAVLRLVLKWRKKGTTWRSCSNQIEEILARRDGRKPIVWFWQETRRFSTDSLRYMVDRYNSIGTLKILDDDVYWTYRSRHVVKNGKASVKRKRGS